jgi:hypothetical protein
MTQYYLVKYKDCWADEFYVEGLALLDEVYKEYFDYLTNRDLPITHYIGTNEEIEYTDIEKLVKCYTWIKISYEECITIQKLIGNEFGMFFYPEKEDE